MRFVLLAAKTFVSLGILAYLLWHSDLGSVVQVVGTLDPFYLTFYTLQLLVIPLIGSWRWQLMLYSLGYRHPWWSLVRMFWVGMIFNQFLPTAVGGDAVRAWMAYHEGIDVTSAITTVVMERVWMLLTLFAMVAVTNALAPADFSNPWMMYFTLAMLIVGFAGLAALPIIGRLVKMVPSPRLVHHALRLIESTRVTIASPSSLTVVVLCVLTHTNLVVAGWLLGQAFGLPVTLPQFFVVIPIVVLAAVFPISIGGWGVREAAMLVLLGGIGISHETGVAFAIFYGLSLLLVSLPGFVLLWWKPSPIQFELPRT